MKKLLLAAFVASALALSACEDTNLPQKVFEAEKKIVQLETDLKKSQVDLKTKSDELGALKREHEGLKNQYTETKTTLESIGFPSLKVTIEPLFEKSEHLKFGKAPKDEFAREDTTVSMFVSVPKTQIEWLNQLLLAEMFKMWLVENEKLPENITAELLTQRLQERYGAMLEEAKEFKPIALSESLDSFYIGQRNGIVTFSLTSHSYSGGAHGMFAVQYVNVDTNKKAVIGLNDLIGEKNQTKVKELLWEQYRIARTDINGKYVGFADKKDFRISDDFYFSPTGITFVYPPYELGSFAEGVVEVSLSWYEVNALLNGDYQLKAQDGFGLNKIEN